MSKQLDGLLVCWFVGLLACWLVPLTFKANKLTNKANFTTSPPAYQPTS